ncbi:retrovirus-related pol polyprotein from transposon TNT 1-94 [Tanacetum coccineum]
METKIAKCSVERKTFEIKEKELLLENDRLLKLLISQDLVHTPVDSLAEILDYQSMEKSFLDEYSECVELKAELSKKNDMVEKAVYDELSNRCARIENRCISLQIKELLVYVSATCPSSIKPSEKLIAVTPRNTNRKVRSGVGDVLEDDNNREGQERRTFINRLCETRNGLVVLLGAYMHFMHTSKDMLPHGLTMWLFLSRPYEVKVIQIVLWYLDSGCSKHMFGNRSQLINFVSKFMGTIQFGNAHVAAIRVGQFCDSDLEVAFRKHTCFVCVLEGVDLLKGSRGSNLYTLSLEDMMQSSPICLLSKASRTKSWLWHQRLSHLNIGYINELAKQGLV